MSSSQTLSPGGEPQLGRPRFSSPMTGVFVVAQEGTHPMNLFPPPMVALPRTGEPRTMSTLLILAGKGYSRGRCPVSRFPWMANSRKLLRSSTHNGNSPDSWLFARCNVTRLEISPISDGIGPVSLLPWSRRRVRLDRFPSSFGIDPVRLLSTMYSCVRLGRLPSSGGSVPFSGLGDVAEMKIVRMRSGVPHMLIPSQADIAVVAFQLREPVPRRVSFSPQRTLQSAMSPVFVWSGTTVVVSHGCVVCPRTSNSNWPETSRSAKSIAAAPAAMYHRKSCPERLFLRRGGEEGGGVKNVRRARLVHSVFLWRAASGVYVWRAAFVHVGLAYTCTMIRGEFAVVKGGFWAVVFCYG